MGQHCKSKRRRRRRVHVEEGSAEEEGNACGAGKVVLHEIQNYFLCMWRRRMQRMWRRTMQRKLWSKKKRRKPRKTHKRGVFNLTKVF